MPPTRPQAQAFTLNYFSFSVFAAITYGNNSSNNANYMTLLGYSQEKLRFWSMTFGDFLATTHCLFSQSGQILQLMSYFVIAATQPIVVIWLLILVKQRPVQ